MVSSVCLIEGPIVTTRLVLELPPRESYKRRVSLDSLKGIKFDFPSDKADMHLPRALKELLIALASWSLSPVDFDFFTLSEPARSTIYKIDVTKETPALLLLFWFKTLSGSSF